MSDLISRSGVIRKMWDRYNSEYNDASKYDEEETKLAQKIIADMQMIVETEPTAYDVEKVVEELEDYLEVTCELSERVVSEAIDIVRGGRE